MSSIMYRGFIKISSCALLILILLGSWEGRAQEEQSGDKTSVALSQEVINPTTLAWQLQLEEFIITHTENQSGVAQNFRVRGIIPVQKGLVLPFSQLIRIIGFVNTAPGGKPTGLGDLTLNQFFILAKKDWGQFGAGWNLTIPTASKNELGSPQWQVGPAFTVTFTDIGNWQMYWIWENFFSVSKNDEYGESMYAVLQPNIFYTWANGVYAGIEPEWQIDYETGKVALPMDFRIGYVWAGKLKYNAYIEPEFMAYRSKGYSRNLNNFGVRLGFRWYLPM
ncbi:hypothetical protein BFP72_08450 [Reichenbachiella sp. 5M10]|uniref:hypothetical protein n=1 Tax=Reichenbachiella sp. 5M10 TaxID=1889772 RepID=UPI000C15FC1E|nr:hypothetical protein [Reichenbachiella sp. 5M10]PIB35423.1 hypothetical protein BFP72_08450 [Reichenbachiella sp. 5M10]